MQNKRTKHLTVTYHLLFQVFGKPYPELLFLLFLIMNIEVINTGPYNNSLKVIVTAPKEQILILFKKKQV